VAAALALPLVAAPGVAAAGINHLPAAPAFQQVNLVADVAGVAPVTDPNLVNPWGLALSPTSPLWVANNGTDTSTLYAGGAGGTPPTIPALVVAAAGAPTGQAFNGGTQFVVTGPSGSGPARFLFVNENGDLLAWNPTAAPTTALVVSHVDGALYRGLTIGSNEFGSFLLAADFHNKRIDVFDSLFRRSNLPAPAFTDPRLPRDYSPFNVEFLGGHAYVAYAKLGPDGETEVAGRGNGFVSQFDRFGRFERRIASRGTLNTPWGLEIAPASFGSLSGDLLVGNFGDGRIGAYDPATGRFRGLLRTAAGSVIVIDGLWDLLRGTANSGGADAVWFSAGPNDEQNGLLGLIRPAPAG
jgi:uncharacterized protein (TIGR03118 family)